MKLSLKGKKLAWAHYDNSVDYVVTRSGGPGRRPKLVMYGFFDKTDPAAWRFEPNT